MDYKIIKTNRKTLAITVSKEQQVIVRAPKHITKKEIDNYFAKRLVVSYSRSGRYKLIRKDFKGARKDYLFSITHFGLHKPVWKLRSLIGIFMSLFHGDVEWLATLIGNTSYK